MTIFTRRFLDYIAQVFLEEIDSIPNFLKPLRVSAVI